MSAPILGFQGEYRFLSNFYPSAIRNRTGIWPTAEHLYQASKSTNPDDWRLIRVTETPGRAKRAGRQILLRSDWDEIKDWVMLSVVRLKFLQNRRLAQLLVDTGDAEIVELNSWGDRYWGECPRGEGKNRLGEILMQVRKEIGVVPGPFPL